MSYEYAGMLFNTPRQASRAAVSDYLYAGGNNSTETVSKMNIAEVTAELTDLIDRNEWDIPYLDQHNQPVAEMVREMICEALEEVMSDDE